jgi:hypothetical protein
MVTVSGIEDVKEEFKAMNITITPDVKGKWRWHGAKTLQFEAEHRLPFATDYTVVVPAGLTSKLGGKLAKDFTWKFTTIYAQVEGTVPYNNAYSEELCPVIQYCFNQRVKPEEVLKDSHVTFSTNPKGFFFAILFFCCCFYPLNPLLLLFFCGLTDPAKLKLVKLEDVKYPQRSQFSTNSGREDHYVYFTFDKDLPLATTVSSVFLSDSFFFFWMWLLRFS